MTVALYIVEILAYLFLGSGEEQPWNKQTDTINRANIENGETAEATPLNVRDGKKAYD